MKKLHKLILRSYLGPFIATFMICMFVLLMQFLWKYVDDLIGKGLDTYVIFKLLVYTSASLVPMALPISILLSSIMTFGNLGEHFELVGFKSAGISLVRIMYPLIIVSILLSGAALFFSNYVLPVANLKSGALLYDIREKKPTISIKEGIFYNGLDNFSIRVRSKNKETDELLDIIIYDHSQHNGNTRVITAEKGKMKMSTDERYMILTLENGFMYEEVLEKNEDIIKRPHQKTAFKTQEKKFDLSAFKMKRTDENLFKENYQMLDIKQLRKEIDTVKLQISKENEDLKKMVLVNYIAPKTPLMTAYFVAPIPVTKNPITTKTEKKKDSVATYPVYSKAVIEKALTAARDSKKMLSDKLEIHNSLLREVAKYDSAILKKFSLSFACLILFFIGAPLGAIIRKGGLGLPAVISVVFFIIFHVLTIIGEKAARELAMPVFAGMWLASGVLLPIGIFLTIKATADSTLLDMDAYFRFFKPIKNLFTKKDSKV